MINKVKDPRFLYTATGNSKFRHLFFNQKNIELNFIPGAVYICWVLDNQLKVNVSGWFKRGKRKGFLTVKLSSGFCKQNLEFKEKYRSA